MIAKTKEAVIKFDVIAIIIKYTIISGKKFGDGFRCQPFKGL